MTKGKRMTHDLTRTFSGELHTKRFYGFATLPEDMDLNLACLLKVQVSYTVQAGRTLEIRTIQGVWISDISKTLLKFGNDEASAYIDKGRGVVNVNFNREVVGASIFAEVEYPDIGERQVSMLEDALFIDAGT